MILARKRRSGNGRKDNGKPLSTRQRLPWPLLFIFLFLTMAIAGSGYFYYQTQKKRVIKEQTAQLRAIADLKANEINRWLKERLGDARQISQNPFINAELAAFLGDRSPGARKDSIQRWMKGLQNNYHYENVLLIDREGKIALAGSSHNAAVGYEELQLLESVRRRRDAVLSDLLHSPKAPHVHLDAVTSVLSGEEVSGFVLLRIDPNVFLFP